jgi:general secretion pathway protein M
MDALAGALPALRRQAEAMGKAGGSAQTELLAAADDAVAGAALQEQVQRMAADADATLASMEVLPPEKAGEYRRIGLRLAISGGRFSALVRLLQDLATATPRMLVDELEVHALQTQDRSLGTRVDASFDVLAFRSAAVAQR